MKKNLLLLVAIVAFSCAPRYRFRDVADFNLQPNALKDGEPVRLLYCSNGPEEKGQLDYYIQIIAVSQKTGDTVNILTPFNNGFTPQDGDKIYNYISPDNQSYAFLQMDETQLKNLSNVDSLPRTKSGNITRVARDADHDDVAHNRIPTVIGAIGTVGNINK